MTDCLFCKIIAGEIPSDKVYEDVNNKFLNQLIADSLDREVVTGPVEGAAIGNLLTQAMALGDIKDLDELRQVVRNSENVETWQPNHTAAWDEAYQRMRRFS